MTFAKEHKRMQIGHGITSYTSNLLYFGESGKEPNAKVTRKQSSKTGGVHEAFSDMMGKYFHFVLYDSSSGVLPK